ncbi:Dipeptidyl aminopeptidase/acylaminoacyl peptidase [Dyadobacter koreensis]|uniref:Dipeptidyl aminopeptidase/acylaminoacyl peptidase n=1 Tax=Dyadobacter koreensis TaxID=408657 RepID=A0A1H6Q0V5_9BACT|nr:S9 family peptidase [Dyadobacter koreensis]SEI37478.1 Dipeptidyl aminopeptidase/acylaminoacyl peptidase [Dyadobacter koreensis]
MKPLTFCIKTLFVSALLSAFSDHSSWAQKAVLPAYKPSPVEINAAYKRMERMDSLTRGTVLKATIQPGWQADGNSFWYKNILKDSISEYFYVNPSEGKKTKAFDNEIIAKALSSAADTAFSASKLMIQDLRFDLTGKKIFVKIKDKWFDYNTEKQTAAKVDKPGIEPPKSIGWTHQVSRWRPFRADSLSPDKKQKAYVRNGNIYLSAPGNKDGRQLTYDGNSLKPYGELSWSPDGTYLVCYRISPQEEKQVSILLSSIPNTTRAEVKTRGYAQPGDEFTSYEMHVINVKSKESVKVKSEIIDFFEAPVIRWRNGDNKHFTYEKVDRGHQRFRVIDVDASNGETRNVIDEKTETFIYQNLIYTNYQPKTHEIIWSSEKDGWRHLYLVDELTGKIKNQITKGEWVVRDIDSIDTEKREIWFRANGMNPGEDPYHLHYYRIKFDGTGLVKLTGHAEAMHSLTFSPDRKYYIDTYSTMEKPPVSELRKTDDATLVSALEQADISAYLSLGFKLPEIFKAKGRDRTTDIWGIVYRPSKFDPKKKYPIIENIYAGPQDSFVPKSFRHYGEMQSIAELGFIVVQMDGMGTANRSKAFHDVCWKNLADAGFADRILWMKALASKYAYADTSRVGVYGTSAGGQNSLGALLFHPGFYDVAVSACGCHDNRVDKQWWNEQWMGYPVGKHYDEQSNITNAAKLRGDLLLIVGEADTNVPPESTYRVADALIKSNKDFELLVVPGMGHSDGGPYGRRKKRDFFVHKLLGVNPPNRNKGI